MSDNEIDVVDIYDYLAKHDVEEPVTILKDGRPHAVVIPYELYATLQKSNRQALHISELSDADMNAILNSEIAEECKEFDGEMKKS